MYLRMPNSFEVKEMTNLFRNKIKGEIKLGKQIGTPSAYGAVFEIKGEPKKVVKIFKARRLSRSRREAYISIFLGREGVGPLVYRSGMVKVKPGDFTVYCVMEKIDGDIYTLKRKNPKLYKKYEKEIEKEVVRLIENMHKLKFVHADIKEDNMAYRIIKGKIQLYIIDFGFSSLMPFSIKTNKNLSKAIVRAYKEQNFTYKNMVNADAIYKVQRRFNNELSKNKILKITCKKGVNINSLYKKMNKSKYKLEFVNIHPQRNKGKNNLDSKPLVKLPGVFRYKLVNEHWIIYHPEEIFNQQVEGKGRFLRNRLSN